MEEESYADEPAKTLRTRRPLLRRIAASVAVAVLVYWVASYLVVPVFWSRYVKRHPSLDEVPGITHTKDGIPGDPINVALIGTESDLKRIMLAARWYPADELSLYSDLRIAADTVLERQYDEAPVSDLYLFGRKQDRAFEQPVGPDPRHRHHVRFWRADTVAPDGRPVWVGSATYDKGVGLSHTTGQITHHIAADIDAERERLLQNLQQTGDLSATYLIAGYHQVLQGRNGGGDPWYTDGSLRLGVIVAEKE